MITLKRAYDPASPTDGTRYLVERPWPRGVSKARLRIDTWLKEVGPSAKLRQWFNHDPDKWGEFRRRYFRELGAQPKAWRPSCPRLDVTESRSSIAHATRNTTMRLPCRNSCEGRPVSG
jgi:uncharacterized protein YeaO (DUF488 family)